MTAPLFSPFSLRDLSLPNRIVVSPMCQYSAEHGRATDWHLIHLGNLAMSGAALMCIEATAVEPDGRITPSDLGLWDDATEQALARVLAAVRRYSRLAVVIQLAHAGRKGSSRLPWEGGQLLPVAEGGWVPHAPSAVPYKEGELPPAALDEGGLTRVRDAFAASARRAMRLGLDGVEVHLAHGYLLHEFLSPLANHRTDAYGGSLEGRMRFPLEVFDAIRAVVPAGRPVGVKVSATDWVEGGWDLAQTIELARELGKRGVDWVTASSGGVSPLQKVVLGPGYQVPFARGIKEATGVGTMAVGLITEPRQADEVVSSGAADLVALARGMLYEPRWGWHAAAALGAQIDAPPPYWRAAPASEARIFRGAASGQR
ncbi:MAG TPA: NADH:flavin oxidoreductase/NADH oxidase [Polyangiaceae bacterium]|jgi:2,4-dienoyl-CoA reductase-like NADH-dependent reductase (Old Yellow Enzyme family)